MSCKEDPFHTQLRENWNCIHRIRTAVSLAAFPAWGHTEKDSDGAMAQDPANEQTSRRKNV
jgi:hypothetical protein